MVCKLVKNIEVECNCDRDASLPELAYQMDFRYV